uniref:Uncharacterized protein n=1 Tax=Candidatus Kentrum sp. FW TaxID=2126338 RepID=A0A450SPA0_9GAMM|nr:MAG: hypothetical protein BECKFW1821B_GA0114236_102411 [Candidatus Kentron sp. FW]
MVSNSGSVGRGKPFDVREQDSEITRRGSERGTTCLFRPQPGIPSTKEDAGNTGFDDHNWSPQVTRTVPVP